MAVLLGAAGAAAAAGCSFSAAAPGRFLAGYAPGFDPAARPYANTLAAAQAWCCAQGGKCGGVTLQSGGFDARASCTPEACHSHCDNVTSWVNTAADCYCVPDAGAPGLDLRLSPNGTYSVFVAGCEWLRGGATAVRVGGRNYSSADGSLALTATERRAGEDAVGAFDATVATWSAGGVPFETHFRVYRVQPGLAADAVVFEQRFPSGANGTAIGGAESHHGLLSQFPVFDAAAGAAAPRGFVDFGFRGVPRSGLQTGAWPPPHLRATGWEAAGALAVFDERAGDTVVVSPYSAFSTTQNWFRGGVLAYGARGSIEAVPPGFVSGTVVVAGRGGISDTMREWGLLLMRKGGKDPDAWRADYSLKYLGYTTDNGAYYYYNTEPGKNYEQTMLDLHAYTISQHVPVKWILYDSWWYSKSKGMDSPAPSHGCMNWSDADPTIFPSGMRSMYRRTGWPVVAHARAWAKENVYAQQNGGGYEFEMSPDFAGGEVVALPLHRRFYDDLFRNTSEWGCLQFQRDWMYTQAGMVAMRESATLGRQWRRQISDSLAAAGMRFGFGGVMGADWLMSTEQQVATNGRVSQDYYCSDGRGMTDQGASNWDIGVASIFSWALSVIPAKDGYYTTPAQPGQQHYKDNRTEPYGALHAAVATLSRGPVSPADKIGLFNRPLIMRSCMEDGTLLQPDIPALAIDAQLLRSALGVAGPDGKVWKTHTVIDGLRYHHVLVPELATEYALAAEQLGAPAAHGAVVVENGRAGGGVTAVAFGAAAPLRLAPCGPGDFGLYHAVPLLANGWGFVGETAKFVAVSAARVRSIAEVGDSVEVRVAGVPAERVSLGFVRPAAGAAAAPVSFVDCVFGEAGELLATPAGCRDVY